jgi:hypothetical protein
MKDIFIDNDVATNFLNPPSEAFKDLIRWIKEFSTTESENNAFLVVSNKLLKEYLASNRNCFLENSIVIIVAKLTKEERLRKFSNDEIESFKNEHFSKKVSKKLTCNQSDRDHIPIVLLSNRKIALTNDNKFGSDLVNFPGFNVIVSNDPSKINYL